MADPKALTRNQIAAFVGTDPEAIRAIERLFKVAGELTPADIAALNILIEESTLATGAAQDQVEVLAAIAIELGQRITQQAIQTDSSIALAQSALAQLERIADAVQGLALAQPVQPTIAFDDLALPVQPASPAFTLADLAPAAFAPAGIRYRQLLTATAGQTLFNLGASYAVGQSQLYVFVNGLLMETPGDYAETSSSSITFASGLAAGDEVVVIILK
jgi:hypothetical protein